MWRYYKVLLFSIIALIFTGCCRENNIDIYQKCKDMDAPIQIKTGVQEIQLEPIIEFATDNNFYIEYFDGEIMLLNEVVDNNYTWGYCEDTTRLVVYDMLGNEKMHLDCITPDSLVINATLYNNDIYYALVNHNTENNRFRWYIYRNEELLLSGLTTREDLIPNFLYYKNNLYTSYYDVSKNNESFFTILNLFDNNVLFQYECKDMIVTSTISKIVDDKIYIFTETDNRPSVSAFENNKLINSYIFGKFARAFSYIDNGFIISYKHEGDDYYSIVKYNFGKENVEICNTIDNVYGFYELCDYYFYLARFENKHIVYYGISQDDIFNVKAKISIPENEMVKGFYECGNGNFLITENGVYMAST